MDAALEGRAMIKNLQRAVGTTQDGIAGPATYTALFRKCGASVERAEANLLLTALP